MKVKELIKRLQKLKDKEKEINVILKIYESMFIVDISGISEWFGWMDKDKKEVLSYSLEIKEREIK